jgi:ABC-2 type transport system permease protein
VFNLLRSEIFRLRKRPQSWILMLIMVIGVSAVYTGFTIAALVMQDPSDPEESLRLSNIFETGMQFVSLAGYILTVVVGATIIGNEYSWNTIRPLVARARSRNSLLSAKWITVACYTTGLLLIGLVATILSSMVATVIVGNFDGVTLALIGDWIVSFGRMVVGQAPYVALAFFLALLTRSNAVGIAVGIGLGLLEPVIWELLGLITDRFEEVRKFGLDQPSSLMYTMNADFESVSSGEAWRAVATLGVWTAVFVGLTYYFFNKRDVTG